MHNHYIEDERGEILDIVPLCSDSCNREYSGRDYAGWSGCHELEHTDYCANCGVVLPGFEDACECQFANVVVNRFLSDTGEVCGHGNWIQVPRSMIVR